MSTVYITAKTTRKRARKEVIQEIEERINLFSEDKKVSENEEMKVLDYYVREVVQRGERSEEQMKREMEKKNDLVTYLAHDLKTPLTSVIGYLTILDESELPKEIREEYTRKVLSRAYDLENLTNQFFDITRFNLNEIPLNKRGMNGEFFFTQITEELYPLMKEKGMRVEVHIPKEMEIYGDGKLLARVFNNLMKNAVAYSFRDTEISLYGEELGDDIEIRIENHGEVIDHRELQLIFEKFYRRDISRNRTKGAGLGLAIAKEIVQKHGGELSATSTGGKTEFKVRLPKS